MWRARVLWSCCSLDVFRGANGVSECIFTVLKTIFIHGDEAFTISGKQSFHSSCQCVVLWPLDLDIYNRYFRSKVIKPQLLCTSAKLHPEPHQWNKAPKTTGGGVCVSGGAGRDTSNVCSTPVLLLLTLSKCICCWLGEMMRGQGWCNECLDFKFSVRLKCIQSEDLLLKMLKIQFYKASVL